MARPKAARCPPAPLPAACRLLCPTQWLPCSPPRHAPCPALARANISFKGEREVPSGFPVLQQSSGRASAPPGPAAPEPFLGRSQTPAEPHGSCGSGALPGPKPDENTDERSKSNPTALNTRAPQFAGLLDVAAGTAGSWGAQPLPGAVPVQPPARSPSPAPPGCCSRRSTWRWQLIKPFQPGPESIHHLIY